MIKKSMLPAGGGFGEAQETRVSEVARSIAEQVSSLPVEEAIAVLEQVIASELLSLDPSVEKAERMANVIRKGIIENVKKGLEKRTG